MFAGPGELNCQTATSSNSYILVQVGGLSAAGLLSCGLARQGALFLAALHMGWHPAGPDRRMLLQIRKPTAACSRQQVQMLCRALARA